MSMVVHTEGERHKLPDWKEQSACLCESAQCEPPER